MNEPTKGIIDINGNIIADLSKYDWVSDFDELGYAYVESKGLIGLVNIDGKEILPPKYENVWVLDSDHFLALFNKTSYNIINAERKILKDDFEECADDLDAKGGHLVIYKNGKCGLCTYQGEMLIDYKYQRIIWVHYIEYYLLYPDEIHVGIADSNGRVIVPAIFVDLHYSDHDWSRYDIARHYIQLMQFPIVQASKSVLSLDHNNCAVKIDDKWRFIDKNGNLLDYDIPSLDDRNWNIDETFSTVFIIEKNGLKGVFYDGKIIISAKFDEIDLNADDSKICCKKGDKVQYYDYDGNLIYIDNNRTIGISTEDTLAATATNYFEGDYKVISIDNKVGLIDAFGDIVIPTKYDEIKRNYSCRPGIWELISNNQYGWFVVETKAIIEPRFDKIIVEEDGIIAIQDYNYYISNIYGNFYKIPMFSEIKRLHNGNHLFEIDGLWGMFDMVGNILLVPIYSEISDAGSWFGRTEILKINKNNHYGLANLDGEIILEPRYDMLSYYSIKNFCLVKIEDKYQIVDIYGHDIFNESFDEVEPFGKLYAVKKNGKWGLVSIDGNIKIPIENDYINTIKAFITPKNTVIRLDDGDQIIERDYLVKESLNDGYSVTYNIDQTKDLRSPDFSIIASNIDAVEYKRDFYLVQKENEYGLLNISNGLYIKPKYDEIEKLGSHYVAKLNGQIHIIHDDGTDIAVPFLSEYNLNEIDNPLKFINDRTTFDLDAKRYPDIQFAWATPRGMTYFNIYDMEKYSDEFSDLPYFPLGLYRNSFSQRINNFRMALTELTLSEEIEEVEPGLRYCERLKKLIVKSNHDVINSDVIPPSIEEIYILGQGSVSMCVGFEMIDQDTGDIINVVKLPNLKKVVVGKGCSCRTTEEEIKGYLPNCEYIQL